MKQPLIDTDERLDTVVGTDIRLIQKIDGTAFAIDTLLLANFIKFSRDMNFSAELGSGSGILSFMLKYRHANLQITGFEIQETFFELSQRNLQLNPAFADLSFEHMDIRDIPSRILPESFDMVCSNPPYFPKGNGRLPSRPGRAMARHELNGTLEDFVSSAAYMLSYSGKFYLVIPSNRFYEVVNYLKANNLGLKRLQFVIPKEGEESHLALIEAEKFFNGKHEPVPNITIHMKDGSYGPELNELFAKGLKKWSL
jgi:tRNA1Val (adenine37-N6)-methyltransferase